MTENTPHWLSLKILCQKSKFLSSNLKYSKLLIVPLPDYRSCYQEMHNKKNYLTKIKTKISLTKKFKPLKITSTFVINLGYSFLL